MKTSKILGLIGSSMLFIGVFAPLVSVPILGSVNFYGGGKGDGVGIVILASISFVLIFLDKVKELRWTGLLSLLIIGYAFFKIQSKISEIKSKTNTELADNPFRGLADLAVNSFQIQWGFAVLLLGSMVLIWAASVEWRDELTQSKSGVAK